MDNYKKIVRRQNLLILLGLFVLIVMIGGVTFAFFNYTKTGSSNILKTGNITFSSDYESVEMINVFPIDKTGVLTDQDNVMTINVSIEGSTTYEKGIYYEVKADDVHLTVNGKNIPIGISVTSNNLDNVTLTSYEDGKILTNGSFFAEGRILKSDSTHDNSVDGTITIKAYLDRNKIAITDTIENGPLAISGYTNGTTNSWINGRVVLTTEEWNSLTSTPLSFKVRVEAIENDVATLVDGMTFIGKVKKLANPNLDDSRSDWQIITMDKNIKTFQRVTEKPDTSEFTEDNDISAEGSVYPIYAWYDDNGIIKYYSESKNIKANKNMSNMFNFLQKLEDIGDLALLDTTNVINMSNLFRGSYHLTSLEFLSNWNTSNVTDMANMFYGYTGLSSLNDISSWNTSNVTDMAGMFYSCTGLSSLSGISNWNTSNVTDMTNMFYNCIGLTSLDPLSNWNVSNVNTMLQMFSRCAGLTSLSGIANWNVANISTMQSMFFGCTGLTSLEPLANWNTSNVTDMAGMFYGCIGLSSLNDISGWNVSNVATMRMMFVGCTALSDASGINNWDITNVDISNNGFLKMFNNTPSHPTFTKRTGTWDDEGTFIPSA